MKSLLPALVLTLITTAGWAQTDPFKDDRLKAEKQRQFIVDHKIKEVDQYLVDKKDGAFTRDSTILCKFYYSKKGELTKTVWHTKMRTLDNMEGSDYEVAVNYDYKYDKAGNVIKVDYSGSEVFQLGNTYEYDDKGRLAGEGINTSSMITFNSTRPQKEVRTYEYNDAGKMVLFKRYDATGRLIGSNEYKYDAEGRLITDVLFIGSPGHLQYRRQYQYTLSAAGLTKLASNYNGRDSLTLQKEYVYDKNNQQVKGYEIRGGLKQLVWDYTYNDKGQVTTSKGGPGAVDGLPYGDIRLDGLAYLVYRYSTDGNLIEIKKYEADPSTGQQQVTAIEKIGYKKY